MSNKRRSYLSSAIDIFTVMMNTPLVEPESVTRPKAIPLKTFSESSRRASSETYQESTTSSSSSTMHNSWGPRSSSFDSIPTNANNKVKEFK